MQLELFILNYNGAGFILNTVASMLSAMKNSSHKCRLTVIDNASIDDSVPLILKEYPSVRVLRMVENRVLCSFNDAVSRSEADIVFLLNNDLTADPFFIDPMVSVFQERKDVFLVTAKSFLFDGTYEGGLSIPLFRFGSFETSCRFPGYENKINIFGRTFAAGFGAFDRLKFLELGGYDDLYLPGRMEDADIGLRAWKRGWKSYYQPESILYHMGGKSFKQRFGNRGTAEIAHRNSFLFMWKNIHDRSYLRSHFLYLTPRMIWMLLKGRFEFVIALFQALNRIKLALARRGCEKKAAYQLTDRNVVLLFGNEK